MKPIALTIKLSLTVLVFLWISLGQVYGQEEKTPVETPDSTKTDSINLAHLSKNALDEYIRNTASDSIVYDIKNKKVYLYGVANVDYADFHLEGQRIAIDWQGNEIWAFPKMDSAGTKIKQQVLFSDKGKEGEADSLGYNFKTKKGKIYNFRTQEGNAYVIIDKAKKNEEDVLYCDGTKFTTCSKKNPHYWFQLAKAKIIPKEKVITSYAFLNIAKIPIYFGFIPFGYFPLNEDKATSGLIMPNYGFSANRGYFLRDGGFYFALSEKVDLTLTGDIYTYGSWGVGGETRYKSRYKHSGNASLNYKKNYFDNGLGEFEPKKEFQLTWTHRQDPKASLGSTFSASVNIGSSSYNKNNSLNNNDILNSRLVSSVNYSKKILNSPFRFNLGLNHNQNLQTNTISLTLPSANIVMDRVSPFDNRSFKNNMFLRNLGFTHDLNFKNSINTIDSLLFDPKYDLEWDRGFSHSLPISTNFKLFKWINVTPSFRYRGFYNFYEEEKYIDTSGNIASSRVNQSSYAFDYNMSTSFNTTLYGTHYFKKNKSLIAIRHVINPNISVNYTPDFDKQKWGYFDTISVATNTGNRRVSNYSKYETNPLGRPTKGKIGSLGFGVNNSLELKLRDKNDTIKTNATKKVKILEQLDLRGNYNFFADSMELSRLNLTARTILFKSINIQSSAVFDPYARNALGANYDEYLWDVERKIVDVQRFNFNVGTSLRKQMIDAWRKKQRKKASPQKNKIKSPYGKYYTKYKFPFDLRIIYDYGKTRLTDDYKTTQTLSLTGSFEPTERWRVRYTYNYDIEKREAGYTNFEFVRNVHCWEFIFNWTPSGLRKGFFFTFRGVASELQGLKLEKKSNFWDNR